jgi:general secretion pathway protein G
MGGEKNWNGPYLRDGRIPLDPWGASYTYSLKDNGYEIRSAGPDNAMGTADDLCN